MMKGMRSMVGAQTQLPILVSEKHSLKMPVMASFSFSETWLESYSSISMTNGERSSVVSRESGSYSLPGPCCHFL